MTRRRFSILLLVSIIGIAAYTAFGVQIEHTGDSTITDAMLSSSLVKRPAIKAQGAIYFTGQPADDELLTINGRKYEMDRDGDFPNNGGDVQVDLQASVGLLDDMTAIAGAINTDGSAVVGALLDAGNVSVWLLADTEGSNGNSITLAEALTNVTVSHSSLADGADAAVAVIVPFRHTITASEATAGVLNFQTGLTSIENVQITFEDAGRIVAPGATISISGGDIEFTEGTVAWGTNDMLNLTVVGTE